MMSTSVIFAIWIIAFAVLAGLVILDKTYNMLYKGVVLSLVFILFLSFSLKDRFDLFTPIEDKPDSKIEFVYQQHKSKQRADGVYVLLWLTRADNNEEMMYIFPYIGNEKLKKDLDKLRKLVQEKKIGAGPYRFQQQVEGMTEPVTELETITRSLQKYQNLLKEAQ